MVGVSPDDQKTNDRFRESLDLPYPLVGDPDGTIRAAYDVRWPLIGRSKRATFLVARDRRVRLAFHDELHMDAHAEECVRVTAGSDSDARLIDSE